MGRHEIERRPEGTEFRYDPDNGPLDEIVARDVKFLHFEAMGESQFWMGLELSNGEYWHVNFGAVNDRAKWYAHAERVDYGS